MYAEQMTQPLHFSPTLPQTRSAHADKTAAQCQTSMRRCFPRIRQGLARGEWNHPSRFGQVRAMVVHPRMAIELLLKREPTSKMSSSRIKETSTYSNWSQA